MSPPFLFLCPGSCLGSIRPQARSGSAQNRAGPARPPSGASQRVSGLCGPQAVSIPASLSSQTSPDGSRAGREQASGARPTGLLSANPRPPVQLTLTPPRMCF